MENNKSTVITAELNYITETINQGIQDRYQLMSFYITIAGVVAGAATTLFSLDLPRQQILIGVQIATFALGFLGIVFWLKVKRLRQAWRESLVAFNKLKSSLFSNSEINELFTWNFKTIPIVEKTATVNYYSSLVIFLILFFSFGFCVGIAAQLQNLGLQLLAFEVGFSLAAWNIHLYVYQFLYRI